MKVSVCIATYNGENFIRQQLSSILPQLSLNDEVIISDNCSSDSTTAIISSIADSRISVHLFSKRSIVLNFENALKFASGDVIVIADQDDVWLDGRIDRIKEELKTSDLVVTNCLVVDTKLKVLHESLFELIKPKTGLVNNLIKNSYTGCCMAFKRCVLSAALPFPNNLPMHDWWIGLVGEVVGTVRFIDEPFLLYRRHGANSSTLSARSELGWLKRVSHRSTLMRSLIIRSVFKV
jgi:glycosyltransferase involved in cell wall biosynthesis